jgi:hypothetical protein
VLSCSVNPRFGDDATRFGRHLLAPDSGASSTVERILFADRSLFSHLSFLRRYSRDICRSCVVATSSPSHAFRSSRRRDRVSCAKSLIATRSPQSATRPPRKPPSSCPFLLAMVNPTLGEVFPSLNTYALPKRSCRTLLSGEGVSGRLPWRVERLLRTRILQDGGHDETG